MESLTTQSLLASHLGKSDINHSFPLYQLKALQKLSICRTAALGGHAQYCQAGHLNGVWYNSCKHRACPQCQGIARERWLKHTEALLLNCPHHHFIFTIPSSLHNLWRYNRALMTNLLFKATQKTLHTFSENPRYLGAMPGVLAVLHTWGRNLSLHPHLHVLISHGGWHESQGWVAPKKKILFPQKPLMMVFRGKLLALIRSALSNRQLTLPHECDAKQLSLLLYKLGRLPWVVHGCERYENAIGVAKYLARYVKGGPFHNRQLSRTKNNQIHFRYRSHQTKRRERIHLSEQNFILRLVQHVPLPGKPMARYAGLYSSACRLKLNEAREALGQQPVTPSPQLCWTDYLEEQGYRPKCEVCGLPLIQGETKAPERPLQ